MNHLINGDSGDNRFSPYSKSVNSECPICAGTGILIYTDEDGIEETTPCSECEGSGFIEEFEDDEDGIDPDYKHDNF